MRYAIIFLLLLAGCESRPLVVCEGNSLTAGYGAEESYPQALQKLRPDLRVVSVGVNAQTTSDMLRDVASDVDSMRESGSALVVWEITNDLYSGASVAEACQRFAEYCRARKAKGWRVIVLTVLQRHQDGLREDFEEVRQACNTFLRQHYREFSDSLIDLDRVDGLERPDGVHLDSSGYRKVAREVSKAL